MNTPWYETPTFFIVWAILYFAGRALDMWSSQHFDWYGGKEANKFWRHKDGTFNTGLNAIWSLVYFGASCVIGWLSHSWGAAAALIVVSGLASMVMAFFNFRSKRKKRAEQIAMLEQIRREPNFVYQGLLIGRAGRTYLPLFQFLGVPTDPGNMGDTSARAVQAVRDYATNVAPEQWFKY